MEKLQKKIPFAAIFMAYLLGLVCYLLFAVPKTYVLTGKYALLVFATSSVISLLAGWKCVQKQRKLSRLHLLALLFFGWFALSCAFGFFTSQLDNTPQLLILFCLTIPCFLIFLAFSHEESIQAWRVLAIGYNALVSLLALAGLTSAIFGLTIEFPFLKGSYIQIVDVKLNLLTHHNNTAQYFLLAIFLALFMIFITKKRWVRVLYSLDFIVLFITISLTYSRTALLALSVCIASIPCYFLWHYKPKASDKPLLASRMLRLLLCGFLALGVTLASYLFLNELCAQVATVRDQFVIAQQLESALEKESTTQTAEETELSQTELDALTEQYVQEVQEAVTSSTQADLESRSLSNLGTLNTRYRIWSSSMAAFLQSASAQLIGLTPVGVSPLLIDAYSSAGHGGYEPPHAHNIFLQVLYATGWLGLLLFLLLLGTIITYLCKAFFTAQYSFAQICLPLFATIALCAVGLQEALFLTNVTSMLTPTFYLSIAYLAALVAQDNA